MHDLGFAEALHSIQFHVLGETEGIEETKRGDGAGKSEAGLFRVRDPAVDWSHGGNDDRGSDNGFLSGGLHAKGGGRNSSGGARCEGSGGAGKSSKDGELHFDALVWGKVSVLVDCEIRQIIVHVVHADFYTTSLVL